MLLHRLIDVAAGRAEADLVLKNGQIVNVLSGEIHPGDVAIVDEQIAGIGAYDCRHTIDLDGAFICPGFMDGHVHIESSMVTVPEYARTVVPCGTTTVIIDPHEIANVMGTEGISYMLKSSKYNPLYVFLMLPSCVPATNLETNGADLKAIDLLPLFSDKWVLGLGEVMNYPGVIQKDSDVLDKLKVAASHMIDGHAPGLTGKALSAYVAAGIRSDHECTTVAEALEKLRQGMWLMIREGSATRNLLDLLPLVNDRNAQRCLFVTDDKHPEDLLTEGHIDFMIRKAIGFGIDPVQALRMATINTANYYQLNAIGAVAPGYLADIAIVDNLADFQVQMVFKNGRKVAENGKVTLDLPPSRKTMLRGSINVKLLTPDDLTIKVSSNDRVNVIGIVEDQIVTQRRMLKPLVRDGQIVSDVERDILKLAVIERHTASGNVGLGLVQGFGLKTGALASSIAHDSHNIIVVGTNDSDMLAAVHEIINHQGGLALVANGTVLESLPLPIAGLMTDSPIEYVAARLAVLNQTSRDLGCQLKSPFMTLSFLSLPVIPQLKLTDLGLVDVDKFDFIDLRSDDTQP